MFKEPISSLFAGTPIILTGDQGLLKEDGCIFKATCDMRNNITFVSG